MNDTSFARYFRLRPGGIECGAGGLWVGGIALLARDARGAWTKRDERDLNRELSKLYGFPLDFSRMRRGVDAVAGALESGDLARAQSSALLLQLPDPPESAGSQPGVLERQRLVCDLAACGLLKADDAWDEKHPRTGAPPNPGWFAPKSGEPGADDPKTGPGSAAGAPSRGGEAPAFVPPAPAAGVGSLLAGDLSATALDGLATLAGRLSVATILFGAIFVPSDNRIVDEGPVPGRRDMTYRWARDETTVTFKVLIDGQWRTLTAGRLGPDGVFYDQDGRAVARMVNGPHRRQTLVTTVDVLDRALANLRRRDGKPAAAPAVDDHQPKLCPDPTPEPKTTDSANSIAYQEYVSKLPYGWAIDVGRVIYDGCEPPTGFLLEAKADIDFMSDENDKANWWVKPESNPAIQMESQAKAAAAAGRMVVWHAQTERGYRGLKNIADGLSFGNLSVVFDPN
jgi:hypothetical protein